MLILSIALLAACTGVDPAGANAAEDSIVVGSETEGTQDTDAVGTENAEPDDTTDDEATVMISYKVFDKANWCWPEATFQEHDAQYWGPWADAVAANVGGGCPAANELHLVNQDGDCVNLGGCLPGDDVTTLAILGDPTFLGDQSLFPECTPDADELDQFKCPLP